ncbi:hypothetical protein PQR70_21445 [Paraburkholderia madseniana]|uniref:hypothetical protein n=1 Tax=Paraburkholderia madseniana TaxID=2599607 RepID=UPI000BD7D14D|nr:hypothetical protein SAMN05446635_1592 [Burkholderia sp. OK233]
MTQGALKPNEQGRLHIDAIVKQVQFCSKECCKTQLPELLQLHGLPGEHGTLLVAGETDGIGLDAVQIKNRVDAILGR